MNVRRALGVACGIMLACGAGCGHGTSRGDAGADGPRGDAGDARYADRAIGDAEVIPTPAWADGSLTLPVVRVSEPPSFTPCGGARAILRDTATNAHHECVHDGWLYADLGAIAFRTNLVAPADTLEALTPHDADYVFLSAFLGCQSDAVVMSVYCARCFADAIVRFTDVTQPGTVLWSVQSAPTQIPGEQGGTSEFVASDQLMAWLYAETDGPAQLYVAGPHAENPHVLPVPYGPIFDLHADGPHLVFVATAGLDSVVGDIFLWTVGTDAPENLTHDAFVQTWPWISGNRVVWADQRAAPGGGDLESPDNPDIYGMDLTTRVPMRLNADPPDSPALQYWPVISGDWVVWMDARHASEPNPGQLDIADVLELYGYNWTTQREYPVLTGAIHATIPTIVGSDVYFGCRLTTSGGPPPSLFTTPLPTP